MARTSRTRPKKPVKKAAAAKKAPAKKVANSKIQEAQKAANDSLSSQADNDRKKRLAEYAKNNPNGAKLQQMTNSLMSVPPDPGIDQKKIVERDKPNVGTAASQAANKIAGLALGMSKDAKAEAAAMAASKPKLEAANPGLYGKTSTKDRATQLSNRMQALWDAQTKQAKQKGNLIFMGYQKNRAKIRNQGPQRQDENGDTTTVEGVGDLTVTKDQLLGWLADDSKVAQIKDAAEKAGFTIGSYDDVAKLWTAVVSQAATSFSVNNQRVTPWSLISLRGKYLVNGKPADKVTTTTNIDEMDPAQARLMFEDSATKWLGRAPSKQELDDFISKAQTISKANPAVTKTTHHFGLDGQEESQTSTTTGGADVANAQAQVAAEDQAKQSDDYAAYQAAGNYFPMLFEALQSPV